MVLKLRLIITARSMKYLISMLIFLSVTFTHADNPITDSFLQPYDLSAISSSWSGAVKYGFNEGSGEVTNEGYRIELPRLTYRLNANNQLLFTASVPWVYMNNNMDFNRYTIGDPSFFTGIKLTKSSTFTIGVTEPAANRPLEPDVVRFHAFYTLGIDWPLLTTAFQFGPEIPDRYFEEGQDDVLSFGLALKSNHSPISLDVIRKTIVTGRWYDFTKPAPSPLNRTNTTLSYRHDPASAAISSTLWYTTLQLTDHSTQWLLGVEASFSL